MEMDSIIQGVNKLYDNYETTMPQDVRKAKANLLYRELQYYTGRSFLTSIENILSDENIKRFPTIAQIKNYMQQIPQHKEHQEYCDKCEKTGYYNVWQLRHDSWYSFAYRCMCNTTTMLEMPVLCVDATPIKAHNPFPPNDSRHVDCNLRPKTQ